MNERTGEKDDYIKILSPDDWFKQLHRTKDGGNLAPERLLKKGAVGLEHAGHRSQGFFVGKLKGIVSAATATRNKHLAKHTHHFGGLGGEGGMSSLHHFYQLGVSRLKVSRGTEHSTEHTTITKYNNNKQHRGGGEEADRTKDTSWVRRKNQQRKHKNDHASRSSVERVNGAEIKEGGDMRGRVDARESTRVGRQGEVPE